MAAAGAVVGAGSVSGLLRAGWLARALKPKARPVRIRERVAWTTKGGAAESGLM